MPSIRRAGCRQDSAAPRRYALALAAALVAGSCAPATAQIDTPAAAPAPSSTPIRVDKATEAARPVLRGVRADVLIRPIPVPVAKPRPVAVAPEPQTSTTGERTRWRYLVVHHSATPDGSAEGFERFHRGKGWDGLAYHFVITNGKGGPDGELQVSDRWWEQKHGAHAGSFHGQPEERNKFNEFGIGICLIGNFEKQRPTQKQLETLARLIKRLQKEFDIASEDVVGHRHVKSTACPGRNFPWQTLFALLDEPAPKHLTRRPVTGTYERCVWCAHQELIAAREGRPVLASRSGKVNRKQAAVKSRGKEPTILDLPPTMLNAVPR